MRNINGRTVEIVDPGICAEGQYLVRLSQYFEGMEHPIQEFGCAGTICGAVDDAQARLDALVLCWEDWGEEGEGGPVAVELGDPCGSNLATDQNLWLRVRSDEKPG